MADSHKNFSYGTVAAAPSPALSGTSLDLGSGEGALMPSVPFNATVWPASVKPLASNAEIVRVTNVSGDTLTITRAQEGTAAISIAVGYQFSATITAKTLTDAELNITDGTGNVPSGTLRFSNANGVSFGLNGSTMTASHNALTTAALSNHSHGNPQLNLTNLSGTTASNSAGFTLSLSAAAPGAAAENNWVNLLGANTSGNTTASGSTIGYSGINLTLSGTNGSVVNISAPATSSLSATGLVSISTNGSTISIGVPAGTATMWQPFNEGVNVAGQIGNASLHFVPLPTPAPAALGEVHIDRLCLPLVLSNSTNSSGTVTLSHSFGLYTKNGASLSLVMSTSQTLALTFSGTVNNSTYSGVRLLTVPWTTTIGDGRYYVAQWSRTTTGGGNATFNQFLVSQMNSNFSGIFGVNSNRSYQWPLGYGIYSASVTTAMPGSVAFSQIDGTASIAARPPSFFMISSTA